VAYYRDVFCACNATPMSESGIQNFLKSNVRFSPSIQYFHILFSAVFYIIIAHLLFYFDVLNFYRKFQSNMYLSLWKVVCYEDKNYIFLTVFCLSISELWTVILDVLTKWRTMTRGREIYGSGIYGRAFAVAWSRQS